jgi:immunity protein, SdpI family
VRDHGRLISFVLVVAAFAISAIAFPHLPATVPVHWGPSGMPDHFGSRVQAALMIPVAMLAAWIVVGLVPRYDRTLFFRYETRDSDTSTVRPVYNVVVVAALAFMLALHGFDIVTALGLVGESRQPLIAALIISLGMIVIGNYMPRVTRRNAFVGYRLPWAYASEEVWRRTQRAGGYGMVTAGVLGIIGAVVFPRSPVKLLFAALLAQLIVVAIYSYYLARSARAS